MISFFLSFYDLIYVSESKPTFSFAWKNVSKNEVNKSFAMYQILIQNAQIPIDEKTIIIFVIT